MSRILCVALCVVSLVATARAQPEPPDDAYPNRGRYEAKLILRGLSGLLRRGPKLTFAPGSRAGGSLRLIGGLPVLTLAGTPEQIGRQHALLLARQATLLRTHYLLKFLRTPAERARARAIAAELEPHLLPRHRRELQAMAKASNEPYADAVLAQAFLDAYKVAFCSTAVVTGPRSAAGEPLLARNLDFPALGVAHRASLLVVCRPEGRNAYASVGWPGMNGVLTGINEHGLTLAVMVVHEGVRYRPGMPYTLLFRTVLEEARTTDEAIALLARHPRTTTNNLMICDGAGRAAVVELAPGGNTVRRPADGLLICTNHAQQRARHESLTYPGSLSRYRTLGRLLGKAPTIGRPLLTRALQETAIPLANIQAMVFAPASRRLWLSTGRVPAAKGPYLELDLKALLAER